jgi:ribosomal protein S18 acetylase RimI-like enzyme
MEPEELVARRRREVAELWAQTMPGDPVTAEQRMNDILPRHAGRTDFRFLAARTEDGRLAGFAYGYVGAPGEWWHDRVAAALGKEQSRYWLQPGHFEFVELHVHPQFQRRGVGGRLHDALLEGLRSPTAVLSTQRDNEPALALYRRRGWRVILNEIVFGSEYAPYCVLGKELGSTA